MRSALAAVTLIIVSSTVGVIVVKRRRGKFPVLASASASENGNRPDELAPGRPGWSDWCLSVAAILAGGAVTMWMKELTPGSGFLFCPAVVLSVLALTALSLSVADRARERDGHLVTRSRAASQAKPSHVQG